MAVNLCNLNHPLISFAKNRIQGKKLDIAHLLHRILTHMELPLRAKSITASQSLPNTGKGCLCA